jgi:hypothetical protein
MPVVDDAHHHWWKFDFHNHTPASSDFDPAEIDSLTPREWLLAYMQAGVDCVAVTDHNCAGWIGKVQSALHKLTSETPPGYRPLTLFPGMEISTPEPLHILALFAPGTNQSLLDELIHQSLTLVDPDMPSADREVREPASRVIDVIHAHGGLAIAAHVEQDNGLLQGTQDGKRFQTRFSETLIGEILPRVDAVEFQDFDSDCYRALAIRLAHMAKVSGSDWPHNRANAGVRSSWIRMEHCNLAHLRRALQQPGEAVRRSAPA